MRPVHVGCSGWNYKDWRGLVYPEGLPASRWLEHYPTLFDTVEVNSTFYRLASRYLTHIKRLTDLDQGVRRFYERIDPRVGTPKLGPVLWQLPENFHRDDERLSAALAALPAGRHCFEFRHESWFVPEVYELLRAHGAALVIGDDPRRPFQTRELMTDWTFVRFHAGSDGGNYTEEELERWARRIEEWRERIDVYAYFNKDWEGYALR